jgi:hypothetical protein
MQFATVQRDAADTVRMSGLVIVFENGMRVTPDAGNLNGDAAAAEPMQRFRSRCRISIIMSGPTARAGRLLLAAFVTVSTVVHGQTTVASPSSPAGGGRGGSVQAPPRDTGAGPVPVAIAESRISGRVLAGSTGQPLYRALVQLNTGNLGTARWTLTDAEGRWFFADVPAGSYTVVASRDGYVSMGYGQKNAFGVPAPLVVADRATLERLDIVLPQGGVVTGRITDERGEAISGVGVRAMRVRFVNGRRELVESTTGLRALLAGGITDDRGEYRLYGLAPGTYYLVASSGPVGIGRSDDPTSYAVTYAPGTALIAEATPVVVSGDKNATADFGLVRTALSMVSGTLLDASGAGRPGIVRLVVVAPGHAIETGRALSTQADASGAFQLRGVPPGTYFLQGQLGSNAGQELASLPITLSGGSLSNVFLQTSGVGSATGVIRLDTDDRTALPDGIFVTALPADSGAMSARGPQASSRTGRSGEFVIPGLLGRHVVRLQNPGGIRNRWWLKSVMVNGEDVTDRGFGIPAGGQTAIEVVVTDRAASVVGTVRDDSGKPVSDYAVVAFSRDETRWRPHTRFIRAAVPGQDGSFRIEGLPADDYVVVAVPPIEDGDETDPDRLKVWRERGRQVALRDGQSVTVALILQQP